MDPKSNMLIIQGANYTVTLFSSLQVSKSIQIGFLEKIYGTSSEGTKISCCSNNRVQYSLHAPSKTSESSLLQCCPEA